jgi:hypothetical protein
MYLLNVDEFLPNYGALHLEKFHKYSDAVMRAKHVKLELRE